jgi:hypothetical protein
MELVENPALGKAVLELLVQEYTQEKPLPHVTELIYCLTRSYYDRQPDRLPPNEREILLFSSGWGLERLLLKNQQKVAVGILDGIHFSPDFLAFTDVPGELKTTRMGRKRLAESGLPSGWQKQILSYMKCLNITEYELAIFNVIAPELMPFRCKATVEEIEDNWKRLLERKQIYMYCIQQHVAPPAYMFCEEYECGYCRYSVRCEAAKGGQA